MESKSFTEKQKGKFLYSCVRSYALGCGINFSIYVRNVCEKERLACDFEELEQIVVLVNKICACLVQARANSDHFAFWSVVCNKLSIKYELRLPVYERLFNCIDNDCESSEHFPNFEDNIQHGVVDGRLLVWSYHNAGLFYVRVIDKVVRAKNEEEAKQYWQELQEYYDCLNHLQEFLFQMKYERNRAFWKQVEDVLLQRFSEVKSLSSLKKLVEELPQNQPDISEDDLRLKGLSFHAVYSILGYAELNN